MPEWLATDRTTRMQVLGVALQADPKGNIRQITKLAGARITMILEGALLKVSHQANELTVTPGDAFAIPVKISRSAKLPVPAKLEVVVPPELKGLLQIQPDNLTLSPSQTQTAIQIQTKNDSRLTGRWRLILKAHALENDQWPVMSQTEVSVDFQSNPAPPSS